MPDIVRLRYVGANPATVPTLGREVEPDHLVEFPGRILPDQPSEDAVLIESGNPSQVRAWPKSLWRNETAVASKKSKGE